MQQLSMSLWRTFRTVWLCTSAHWGSARLIWDTTTRWLKLLKQTLGRLSKESRKIHKFYSRAVGIFRIHRGVVGPWTQSAMAKGVTQSTLGQVNRIFTEVAASLVNKKLWRAEPLNLDRCVPKMITNLNKFKAKNSTTLNPAQPQDLLVVM